MKVKGEHVCRVFDFGRLEETGEPYIVMENLEDTDLARRLERDGPQPAEAVVGWIIEVCDALAAAHALGIVHRDLKPANVFLSERPDGSLCANVLDFGISKLPKSEAMTRTAALMGSPVYMSPEQMESARDVDARSDIWSLGVMLYELVTGVLPFVADSMVQLAVQVREKEPRPIRELLPKAPQRLADVIDKCLAKRADGRYESVAQLANDLAPLAPSEVSAISMRLSRRLGSRASVQPALDTTALQGPSQPSASNGVLARGRGTFAPLQSTVGDVSPSAPALRRWPFALGATLALGVITLAARTFVAPGDANERIPRPVVPAARIYLASANGRGNLGFS